MNPPAQDERVREWLQERSIKSPSPTKKGPGRRPTSKKKKDKK